MEENGYDEQDNQIFGHGLNHEYTTENRHAARWANVDLG
jgi:hypothetical protein